MRKQTKRVNIAFMTLAMAISAASVVRPIPIEATVVSTGDAAAARSEVTELSVTQEESFTGTVTQKITDAADDAAEFLNAQEGTFDVKYKFTLDKASFVTVEGVCKMFSYNFVGDWSLYLGTAEGSKDFKMGTVWALDSEKVDYSMALEAGTYWLTLQINRDSNEAFGTGVLDSHFINIGVNAQPMVERTGGFSGQSVLDAIPLTNGETSWGCITGVTREGTFTNAVQQQVFTFTLDRDATVNLKRIISRPLGMDVSMSDSKNVLTVTSEDGSILLNTTDHQENVMENALDLKAGTYFVTASYPRFCEVSVVAEWKEDQVISKEIKKLTVKAKAGAKTVTGKTQPLAKVTVKYKGKKYSKKSTNKGAYKVRVPKLSKGATLKVSVSKSGYKTKSVSVTVK